MSWQVDMERKTAELRKIQRAEEITLEETQKLRDLRFRVLKLASITGEPPETVVERAKVYFAFLMMSEDKETAEAKEPAVFTPPPSSSPPS